MTLAIIYGAVFASILLLSEALLRMLAQQRKSSSEINERVRRMKSGRAQDEIFRSLIKDRGADGWSLFEWLNLRRLYQQSGLTLTIQRRFFYILLIFIACGFASLFLTTNLALRLIAVPFATAIICFLLVLRARNKRRAAFLMQLPDAMDIIVRSIGAGHPVTSAISLVGKEVPDPVGSEFGLLSDQLTFGSEIDVALLNMVDRVGVDELNLLAVTMSVQRGSGGNLTEILENLSTMIRERAIMKAKIKAISAEGRITAVIMAVFPFLLYLMLNTLVPTYFDPVWETGYGVFIVGGILVYMSIGIFILYRLVKFDF